MTSVLTALRAARAELDRAENPTPRVDTELLLAHVLGRSRSQLLTGPDLTDAELAEFERLIALRAGGRPLQHLTGTAAFRHLEVSVGPGVFIPRPETELILDLAAQDLAEAGLVVDLCAGSGAIALSVQQEYPTATVLAVERSASALAWLRRNVAGSGDQVQVVAGDVTDPQLLAEQAGRFDVVLSNPPYVPTEIRSELRPEVGHDPDEAVFAGADGLALMPALAATAARLLRPGGRFVVEHDDSHGESLPALVAATGQWAAVMDHPDLTGRPRFVSAIRR